MNDLDCYIYTTHLSNTKESDDMLNKAPWNHWLNQQQGIYSIKGSFTVKYAYIIP